MLDSCAWKLLLKTFKQIIVLGAGFDTLQFRLVLNDLNEEIVLIEIDFPSLIKKKIDIIRNDTELSSLLEEYTQVRKDFHHFGSYYLIGCDLKELHLLQKTLETITELDYGIPTLIISEVVTTYMAEKDSSNLFRWLRKFENGKVLIYEQTVPLQNFKNESYENQPFYDRMIKHFIKFQSPLSSLVQYPTIHDQSKRFIEYGYSEFSGVSLMDVFKKLELNLTNIEMFDEYAELQLKLEHYFVGIASVSNRNNNLGMSQFEDCKTYVNSNKIREIYHKIKLNKSILYDVEPIETGHIVRAAHTLVEYKNYLYIVFGIGNIPTNEKIMQLQNSIIKINLLNNKEIITKSYCISPRIYHSSNLVKIDNKNYIFIHGGRTNPKNVLNETILINIETMEHKVLKFDIQELTRYKHTSSYVQTLNSVFIIGGKNKNNKIINSVWKFDLQNLTWEKELQSDALQIHSHSTVIHKNNLLVLGGLNKKNITSGNAVVLEICNKRKGLFLVNTIFDYNFEVYSHKSVLLKIENTFYICTVGGMRSPFLYSKYIHAWDIEHDKHVYIKPKTEINPLWIYTGIISDSNENNTFYVFGGGCTCYSFGSYYNKNIHKIEFILKQN